MYSASMVSLIRITLGLDRISNASRARRLRADIVRDALR